MLSDLGGAASVALVRMGDALGLYKTLHARGPMTVAELAAAAGVNERYLREWASHQAASNYLSYDPATQKFALAPKSKRWCSRSTTARSTCWARFDGIARLARQPGKGPACLQEWRRRSWGDQTTCFFCAVARFFRPGYHNNLVSNWLPALDGVVAKLQRGRQSRRCRVRPRLVYRADGARRSRTRTSSATTSTRARSSTPKLMPANTVSSANTRFEVGDRQGLSGKGFRSGRIFRLPARHGRSGGRGGARPADR